MTWRLKASTSNRIEGVLEGVGRLFAECGAVHQEEDAAEAPGLEQAIDQGDAGLGLAGAGGHGEQQFAQAPGDTRLDGQDRGLLVGARDETVGLFILGLAQAGLGRIELLGDLLMGRAIPGEFGREAIEFGTQVVGLR